MSFGRTTASTFTVFAILVAVSYSFAGNGLYIEQTKLNELGEPTGGTGTMLLDNDKFRMEDNGSITIGRMDRDILWYFDSSDHTYFEMPILPNDTTGSQSTDIFVRTGNTRKIGEWNCHEVRLNPTQHNGWFAAIDSLTLWISDKPYKEATTYFASIFQAIGFDRSQLETIQSKIGKGFPIEVHISMLGATSKIRVTKIEPRAVSAAQFDPLSGYTKQVMDLSPDKMLKNR